MSQNIVFNMFLLESFLSNAAELIVYKNTGKKLSSQSYQIIIQALLTKNRINNHRVFRTTVRGLGICFACWHKASRCRNLELQANACP